MTNHRENHVTPEQQLKRLDEKFGPGQGATKERAKLHERIAWRQGYEFRLGFYYGAKGGDPRLSEFYWTPKIGKHSQEFIWGWVFGLDSLGDCLERVTRTLVFCGAEYCMTLWAGGWDDYLVDPTSIRPMTAEEIHYHSEGNSRYWPTFENQEGRWLRCRFANSFRIRHQCGTNHCVRVVYKLRGGD